MKHLMMAILIVLICISLSSCGSLDERRTEYFGFEITEFKIIEEEDTHGGFLGDGSYYLILDCSENTDSARDIVKAWKTLPLTETLELAMYGGENDGVCYLYNFAEEAHWSTIRNGVYKFLDRQTNSDDDTDLLNRHSLNFSIAVYDLDTDILYYFEMDT